MAFSTASISGTTPTNRRRTRFIDDYLGFRGPAIYVASIGRPRRPLRGRHEAHEDLFFKMRIRLRGLRELRPKGAFVVFVSSELVTQRELHHARGRGGGELAERRR